MARMAESKARQRRGDTRNGNVSRGRVVAVDTSLGCEAAQWRDGPELIGAKPPGWNRRRWRAYLRAHYTPEQRRKPDADVLRDYADAKDRAMHRARRVFLKNYHK